MLTLQITQVQKHEEREKTKKARSILQCIKLQSGTCGVKPFRWLLSHFHFCIPIHFRSYHKQVWREWGWDSSCQTIKEMTDTRSNLERNSISTDIWLLPASLKLYEEIPELPWENHVGFFWRSGGLVDQVLWKDYWKLWEHGKHLLIVIWTPDSSVFLSTHLLKSASSIHFTIIKSTKFYLFMKRIPTKILDSKSTGAGNNQASSSNSNVVKILDTGQVDSGFYHILLLEIQENGKIFHGKEWSKNFLCKIWWNSKFPRHKMNIHRCNRRCCKKNR